MSTNMEPGKKEVGDLLFEQGKLTEKQLEQVRRRQRRLGILQHKAIVDLNYASEEDTFRALASLNGLEFVDLSTLNLSQSLLDQVPVKVIFHYHTVPVATENDLITLAFSEPPRTTEQGNLRLLLGKRLKVVLATPSAIHAFLKSHFGLGAETIQKLREDRGLPDVSEEIVFDVRSTETDMAVDATIAA